MKLSRLVYEVVTGTIQLPVQTNYDSFVQGEYKEDPDFALQQANALNYINLAMSRLFDYDKIPHFLTSGTVKNGMVSIDGLGDVVNVKHKGDNVEWRLVGGTSIVVGLEDNESVSIEYRMEIPYFTESDVITQQVQDDGSVKVIGTDKDLKTYGVQERMIPYIVEFAKSQLMEYIAPEMSVNHNNRAEQYFNAMPKAQQILAQSKVKVTNLYE